jgi:electron transfer flavoprotein alpha subunit
VLAGSRPLTGDLDWLPVDRRIGLSGQTVKPNLYIACGISGQIEHLVGIKGARTVVAINNDPKAPIHAEADYSIVGDLYDIVPALIQQCERVAAGSR